METHHTQQTSTPDADICGGLRTKSGQKLSETPTEEGWYWLWGQGAWDPVIVRPVKGGLPLFVHLGEGEWVHVKKLDPEEYEWGQRIPAPQESQPPCPAERPTPITDALNLNHCGWDETLLAHARNLERQLAEVNIAFSAQVEEWHHACQQRDKLLAFVESMVNIAGPHPDVNGSSVIPAAYAVLASVKEAK